MLFKEALGSWPWPSLGGVNRSFVLFEFILSFSCRAFHASQTVTNHNIERRTMNNGSCGFSANEWIYLVIKVHIILLHGHFTHQRALELITTAETKRHTRILYTNAATQLYAIVIYSFSYLFISRNVPWMGSKSITKHGMHTHLYLKSGMYSHLFQPFSLNYINNNKNKDLGVVQLYCTI